MNPSVFDTGLFFPQGPVALRYGTWLAAEGGEGGCMTQVSADGKAHGGDDRSVQRARPAGFIWMPEPKVPSQHCVTLRRHDPSFSCRSVAVSCSCIRQKGGRLPQDIRRPLGGLAYQRRFWAAGAKSNST